MWDNGYFFYYSLDNLRYLNNFLNNSWYDNNFLYNSLYFYNFRHFNHFLDNFFNYSRLNFNSLNDPFDRNDFLLNDMNDLRLFNEYVDNFLNLFDSILIHDVRFFNFNFFMYELFNGLNDRFLDVLFLDFDDFLNHGYLNNFLNNSLDLDISINRDLFNDLYLFDAIDIDYFFNDNFDLNGLLYDTMDFNNFLYDFRNFNDSLDSLYNWNNFFDDSIDGLISDFDMVSDVGSGDVLNSFDDPFDDFRDLNNFNDLFS